MLSEESIHNALGEARWLWRGWIYTPAATIWVFLSQCLSQDHSCRDAVARLIAWRIVRGQKPCSAETGAYCTARADLPEEGCQQLVRDTGSSLKAGAPDAWLWRGCRVRVLDGSTITMPDTQANQAEYPQVKSQTPGCGFPIARVLVVFSLSVGTVLEAAIRKYEGKQTGVDGMVRKHQLRATDFRTGRRLGKDDHVVTWRKPARPAWMTRQQYAALPRELELREVRVRVVQKGFRTKSLVVVTTLTDAEEYPAETIASLYRQRWQAELCLRSLKTVLQMDHLRCKRPERVRNEFRMHLVGYNLIRRIMAVAAFESGRSPWEISFKGALQTVSNLLPILNANLPTAAWCQALCQAVAAHVAANRPDRYEPRVVKRRPKPHKLMQQPRSQYKPKAA